MRILNLLVSVVRALIARGDIVPAAPNSIRVLRIPKGAPTMACSGCGRASYTRYGRSPALLQSDLRVFMVGTGGVVLCPTCRRAAIDAIRCS